MKPNIVDIILNKNKILNKKLGYEWNAMRSIDVEANLFVKSYKNI